MNRGAFALFQWTLRRDVQLLRTHLVRGAFAGIMLLVLVLAWARTLSVGAAGLNLFQAICEEGEKIIGDAVDVWHFCNGACSKLCPAIAIVFVLACPDCLSNNQISVA